MKLITTAVALMMATSAIAHETFHTSAAGTGEKVVQIKTAEFSLDGNTWKHFQIRADSDEKACNRNKKSSVRYTERSFKQYANENALEGRTYEMSNLHVECVSIEEAIALKETLPVEGWEEVSKNIKISAAKKEYR